MGKLANTVEPFKVQVLVDTGKGRTMRTYFLNGQVVPQVVAADWVLAGCKFQVIDSVTTERAEREVLLR